MAVIPHSLIEDGFVQRSFGAAEPEAPFLDGAEPEEVGVDLVCKDGDEETADGIKEVVVGSSLSIGEASRVV